MAITYEPIATYTTSTGGITTYTFSSIPSTYTDLVLIGSGRSGNGDFSIRLNGDTATNYSYTRVYGNGSAVGTDRGSNNDYMSGLSWYSASSNSNVIVNFMNYSNTTTYKTVLSRHNSNPTMVGATINLWRSTAAINSIKVGVFSVAFDAGTTFTLYGIKAA